MSARTARRGQSSVIGVVLILGLVVVGTAGVLVVGSNAIQDVQDQASAGQAEVAMSTVDSQVSEVALGYASAREVSLGGQGQTRLDESAGRITVERVGPNATGPPLVDTTMGALEYRTGGTTVAYQGGGVWRDGGTGEPRMVSPPEFHYRWGTGAGGEPTLTFPLVVLRGSAQSNSLRFADGPTRAAFPNASAGMQNPLGSGTVQVTIQSDYYRAWAEYFETRTDADTVTTYDANESVQITLSVPTRGREIQDSIVSQSPTVTVQGGATVDSYNSSEGTYAATRGENGSVYVAEDLANAGGGTIYGDMRVDGDFEAGGGIDVRGRLLTDGDVRLSGGGVDVDEEIIADGDLEISGGGQVDSPVIVSGSVRETGGGVTVNGDVRAGGDYVSQSGSTLNGDAHVGGDFYPANGQNINGDVTAVGQFRDSGVYPSVSGTVVENGPPPNLAPVSEARDLRPPTLRPIDNTIETRVSTAAASNDNAGSDAGRIENGNCGAGYPDCTLTNGTYYLDELPLSNGKLTFDTTGGPVYVVVDGDVSTTGGSSVEAVGPNKVHVYATGDYSIQTDWESVDDRGDQIWLYGDSDSTVTVQGGAVFYGVIYAPANDDITVLGGAEVYGGIVGGVSQVQGGTAIHYDTVLADQKPVLTGGGGAPVTYLHVTVNEIHVEEA